MTLCNQWNLLQTEAGSEYSVTVHLYGNRTFHIINALLVTSKAILFDSIREILYNGAHPEE